MRLLLLIRSLFCRHEWVQMAWLGDDETGCVCRKCHVIRFFKGPGGPLPEGVSRTGHHSGPAHNTP